MLIKFGAAKIFVGYNIECCKIFPNFMGTSISGGKFKGPLPSFISIPNPLIPKTACRLRRGQIWPPPRTESDKKSPALNNVKLLYSLNTRNQSILWFRNPYNFHDICPWPPPMIWDWGLFYLPPHYWMFSSKFSQPNEIWIGLPESPQLSWRGAYLEGGVG